MALIAAGDSRPLRRRCVEAIAELHPEGDAAAARAAEMVLRADDEARENEAVLDALLADPTATIATTATARPQPEPFPLLSQEYNAYLLDLAGTESEALPFMEWAMRRARAEEIAPLAPLLICPLPPAGTITFRGEALHARL